MELYIVMEGDNGYGSSPVQVFSSRKKADAYIEAGSNLYLEIMSKEEVDI